MMKTMDIYVDGSHLKNGSAGLAIVTPDVRLRPTEREATILRKFDVSWRDGCLVWYWSPRRKVRDVLPVERAALRVAFMLAEIMLRNGVCDMVDINSDRLDVIRSVISGRDGCGDEITYMQDAMERANGAIRLNKVKGHNGNRWNELADEFARRAIDERNHRQQKRS